ncbi:MAG: hypothetical protein WCZ16_08735, partial [Desulfosarcinaceae bacterium]
MFADMEEKKPISPVQRPTVPLVADIPERITLRLPPDQANDPVQLDRRLADRLKLPADALPSHRILRSSIDARRGRPCYEITVALGPAAAEPPAP